MITNIRVNSGFASKLPICKAANKIDTLHRRLNVLWGPNGSGKTTLLRLVAGQTFCAGGGWSRLLAPVEIFGLLGSGEGTDIPTDLDYVAPGGCVVRLDWDRAPVFFASGDDSAGGLAFFESEEDSADGITSPVQGLLERVERPSSGQLRQRKLDRAMQLLRDAPDFANIQLRPSLNDSWRSCYEKQIAYLAQRPDDGRVTVIMDEPDKHLDTNAAAELWGITIPHIAYHAQVIVATHHPLALQHADALWIEAWSGLHERDRNVYTKAFTKK